MTVLEQDEKIVRDMGKHQGQLNTYEKVYLTMFIYMARVDIKPSSARVRFRKAIDSLWHKNICDRRYNGKKITYVFR